MEQARQEQREKDARIAENMYDGKNPLADKAGRDIAKEIREG